MKLMKLFGFAALACMMTGCACCSSKKSAATEAILPPSGEMIATNCVRAPGKIVVDGKMDEAWKAVPAVTHFHCPPNYAEPISKTEGRIAWDDEYLYVLLVAQDLDLMAYTDFHDGPTYKDDVLEFFFAPGQGPKTMEYINFEINAMGTVYDAYHPDRTKGLNGEEACKWECEGLKSAVTRKGTLNEPLDKDESWTLEMAIPWKAIPWMKGRQCPAVDEEWSFHFARYDYSKYLPEGKEELSSSAPLPKVFFHDVDHFAPLFFKK